MGLIIRVKSLSLIHISKAVIFANGSDLYSVTYSGEGSAYTEDELLEVLNGVSFQ